MKLSDLLIYAPFFLVVAWMGFWCWAIYRIVIWLTA